MNPVTLTHLLAQTRTAEIARTAERAAQLEPATRPGHRPRWAGLIHRSGRATRPGAAVSPCVPCCA